MLLMVLAGIRKAKKESAFLDLRKNFVKALDEEGQARAII